MNGSPGGKFKVISLRMGKSQPYDKQRRKAFQIEGSRCQGPKAEKSLACSRNRNTAGEAGV